MLPESQRTVQKWFNTAAFEAQPQFTLGNAPTTVGWGPSRRRIDLSLFKDVNVRGNTRLQLRWEVYNLTNVVNFSNPNTALGNAQFGSISAQATSRGRCSSRPRCCSDAHLKWFVCTLLVLASLALPALASAQTADIVGRVTDNSGGKCQAPQSR